MNTAPVSAVISAFNAEAFIAEAIASVQAQTLPVAELLVVDDGSTDRSAEIAESMGARVVRQTNSGLPAARNRCVREAAHDWVAFIDADDIWEPEKIERQMQIVNADSGVGLVGCDYQVFTAAGTTTSSILKKYAASYQAQSKTPCAAGAVINQLEPGFRDISYILVPSFVIARKDALLEVGMFDETLTVAEDFDCFMRVLAHHKLGIAEGVLARRREHNTNQSRHYTQATLSSLAVTYKVLASPNLYPEAAVSLCRDCLPANLRHAGARLIWDGEGKRGRDLLLKSARLKFDWRTMLALVASFTPGAIGRELMKARYYVSERIGV